MIKGFSRMWKGIKQMFGYSTIKSIVGKDIALSEEMIDAINEWQAMLTGAAKWIAGPVRSLRIEQGICREFADAALVEMETGISNKRLDRIYQKTMVELNENFQEGLALGSLIIKPLGAGGAEFVTPDKFIPILFGDDGKPADIGFLSIKRVGDHDYYTRFERHYFVNGNLTIENKCYHSQSREYIGRACELYEVKEWAEINPGPVTFPGMNRMDFGYYRNPIKNKVDDSKCGVSVFDSAKELIEKADIQGARLDWEFESGERAIHADERALKNQNHKPGMPKLNERLYRGLNIEDGKDKELLKEYSPDMRDESFNRGLERYYRDIEFNVGLAYGDLSDVQYVDKTATEVKASKGRKYNRVTMIQNKLQDCLEDFAAGLAFYNGLYTSGYEFNCNFHDSILSDEETQRRQDKEDVAAGIMQPWEYRAKWYGEDEETAKEMVGVSAEVSEY